MEIDELSRQMPDGFTPRTGGNQQDVSDSVATPPNGNASAQSASTTTTGTGTGGMLSRLSASTTEQGAATTGTATPNAPKPRFGPASVIDEMRAASARRFDEASMRRRERDLRNGGMSGRDAHEAVADSYEPVTNEKGLVTAYREKLLGSSPEDSARTETYRRLLESARRGAARNPANGYTAAKNRALKTAMGQAVRQTGAARPAVPGVAQTTVRRNANGTTSRIGMVNNEEVDYGDMPEAEANQMAVAFAGTQGVMDDFYGNDLDFMTNV